jgi:hypothetical protein
MGLAARLDAVMRRARAAPPLISPSLAEGDEGEAGGDMHACVYVCGVPVPGHGLAYTGKCLVSRRCLQR